MLSGILGLVLCVTNCISDAQQTAKPVELPFELIELIFDSVVQDMHDTKIGDTAAALMHVSSAARFRVLKALPQVKLYELDTQCGQRASQLRLPDSLVRYIRQANEFFLLDVALTFRKVPFPMPAPHTANEKITFSSGRPARYVEFAVKIVFDGAEDDSLTCNTTRDAPDSEIFVQDACNLLNFVLCEVWIDHLKPKYGCPPRILNMHQRALLPQEPLKALVIDIAMTLKSSTKHRKAERYVKHWRFDTRPPP